MHDEAIIDVSSKPVEPLGDSDGGAVENGARKMSSTEALKALNEKLGITDTDTLFTSSEIKSVEEMLANSRKEFEAFKESIASHKEDIDKAGDELEDAIAANSNPLTRSDDTKKTAIAAISTFKESIDAMSNLVRTGEDIMYLLVDAIKSTDLIDPDVVESTSHIIEGIRVSIADIIAYNTTKMQLEHQYRLAMDSENLKQKHRLELEFFKSELRKREAEHKSELKKQEENGNAIDVPNSDGKLQWNAADVIRAMRNDDEEQVP